MALFTRPGLTCQELAELVTDYLEGALSRRDRRRFEAHIAACPMCPAYLARVRITLQELGSITEDDIDPAFMAELQQRFRDWRGSDDGRASS
jgi:anti-sigma factor RsiW